MTDDHTPEDHEISGSPYERMRGVLARHLCSWIAGHRSPAGHFLADADLVLAEAHAAGLRFHLAPTSGGINPSDGFVDVVTNSG